MEALAWVAQQCLGVEPPAPPPPPPKSAIEWIVEQCAENKRVPTAYEPAPMIAVLRGHREGLRAAVLRKALGITETTFTRMARVGIERGQIERTGGGRMIYYKLREGV